MTKSNTSKLSFTKLIKVAFIEYYKKDVEIFYANSFKYYYFLILVDVIVDYKKQVFITRIKADMQSFVYQVPPKKQENLTKA